MWLLHCVKIALSYLLYKYVHLRVQNRNIATCEPDLVTAEQDYESLYCHHFTP